MPQTKEQHRLYVAKQRAKDAKFKAIKKQIKKYKDVKSVNTLKVKPIIDQDEQATTDDIEKYQNSQASNNKPIKSKQNNESTKQKRELYTLDDDLGVDLGVEFDRNRDDLGISKQSNKQHEQYQKTEPYQYNFWGNKEGTDNPLDKISNQKNLKAMFGDRCE